jgi:hypothetical protein
MAPSVVPSAVRGGMIVFLRQLPSTARNFGLDPIKSKVVTAFFLYECGSSPGYL